MMPKEIGWYWVRNLMNEKKEVLVKEGIVEIEKYSAATGLYVCFGYREADLEKVTGEFVGPLESPWKT